MRLAVRSAIVLTICGALFFGACSSDQTSVKSRDSTAAAAKTALDSQYTATAMIAAFRKTVPEQPTKFGAGAETNRDSLIAKYARALDTHDTAAFSAMRISVSEFAWLYYLEMPQSKPPYELDPDVLWMQITAQSNKGLGRLNDHVGKVGFGFKSATCDAPQVLGTVALHHCQMTGRDLVVPVTVIERNGLFKFTSYANQL